MIENHIEALASDNKLRNTDCPILLMNSLAIIGEVYTPSHLTKVLAEGKFSLEAVTAGTNCLQDLLMPST